MITFTANIRCAKACSDDCITTASVGIPVTLNLASEFSGLAKTLCFRNEGAAADVALVGDATSATVPVDVLQTPGRLEIGIYAADGEGNIVIPTVWALAGVVREGALPSGVDPSEPEPNWAAQVQQIATTALETAGEAKEIAENATIPVITVTEITGGHRVTISYNGEATTFDVMDGDNQAAEYALAAFPTDTASGSVASFPDGADGIPVKDLTANIEPVQSGSGDPSPDNIRPISGWTGLKLNVSGADTTDPTTYEVDWTDEAGVVYGGTLDMTTGVLTVDRLGFVFNGAETETWEKFFSNEHGCYRFTVGAVKASASGAVRACSHFKNDNVTSGNSGIGYYAYTSGSLNSVFIQIRPDLSVIPDVGAWKAWLAAQAAAGTPVTCWFQPLEEYYQTYQIDPVTVRTLLGQNNIWADTGDVTVEYRADVGLYIDKKLS